MQAGLTGDGARWILADIAFKMQIRWLKELFSASPGVPQRVRRLSLLKSLGLRRSSCRWTAADMDAATRVKTQSNGDGSL
jgi:hypothetical protein